MPGTTGCTSGGSSFLARRKKTVIANVAVARELAGWCWSLAVLRRLTRLQPLIAGRRSTGRGSAWSDPRNSYEQQRFRCHARLLDQRNAPAEQPVLR